MSKWEIPSKGGHMDAADGVYFQNMTMKDVEKRLDDCDLIIIPVGSTEALLDYMERLIGDIMEKFPPGELSPADEMTQRFTKGELEALLKGPLKGGKHLYTVAWPAY